MAIELTDLVCVVTGADQGVGRGLVQGFARRGARVVAGLLRQAESQSAVAPVWSVQMDVTKTEEVRSAVDAILARYGRIDVWINNAGIYPRRPADQITFAEWRRVLDINLDGAWRCCEAVIPAMKKQGGGTIINVGSIALRIGMGKVVDYLASKGGLVGLTRGLARDLGQHGIRVNCVHLGAVRTQGEREVFSDPEALLKILEERQALRGRMTPETIEPVFAFLASGESGDITGQSLTVDRGWSHD